MYKGVVCVNGVALKEPYLNPIKGPRPYGPVTVPTDSCSSWATTGRTRTTHGIVLGLIPMDKVVGRAFVVIWPPSRFGWLHGL